MTDNQKLQAFDTFTSYVSKHNISIMSKPEWEQLYFYCTEKYLFNGKSLISLSTQELYEIGRKLNLDFSKVSSLVKKCYRLESEENDGNPKENDIQDYSGQFIELFKTGAILNKHIVEGNYIAFEILNPLVKEKILEILYHKQVFSDSSFNKNVIKLSYDGYLKLIGQDTATIVEKLKSNLGTIVNDIKNLIPKSKNIHENESNLLEQATDLINNSKMQKSVGNFVSIISKIYGVGIGDVGKAVFSFIKNQYVKQNDETLGRLMSI